MATRGRPRKGNVQVHLHLPFDLIQAIKKARPDFLKPESQEFRHGVLAAHVTTLLWKELRQQTGPAQFGRRAEDDKLVEIGLACIHGKDPESCVLCSLAEDGEQA